MNFSQFKRSTIGAAAAMVAMAAIGGTAQAASIAGAGSTFAYPIYAKWADAYKKLTGVGLNYQSIGSGGGIQQIEAKTVTFGASDMPLSAAVLARNGLFQFPTVMGGVVPVVHIAGVGPGQLRLDGATLASIYLGEITTWNDPRIQRLNPKLKLPATAIAPIYRSDGSGTNFLFTYYLSQTNPHFKARVGANTSVQWPVGIGAKGSEGVSSMAQQTDGAITYVEYAYSIQNKMTYALLTNRAGRAVAPSSKTFQAAAAHADWAHAQAYNLILTDQPGPDSWPITGATFILMRSAPTDAKAAAGALNFFSWAYKNGDEMAASLDYVPLPASLKAEIQKGWPIKH